MVKTVKDIINSISNIGKEEIQEKRIRHPAHEFQAFAYKIAADFNDLENLKIYLNLLKRVDRVIVEQAYSFAIDSKTESKKKAFLWKVKQIRLQVQKIQDTNNFEWPFVLKKIKLFRNKYSSTIISKYSSQNRFVDFVLESLEQKTYKKVLLLGLPSQNLITALSSVSDKIYFYDLSKQVRDELVEKLSISNIKVNEVTTSDPTLLKYKDEFFDVVIVDSVWTNIIDEKEAEFLSQIYKLTKNTGEIYLNAPIGMETKQSWNFLASSQEDMYFQKTTTLSSLVSMLDKQSLHVIHQQVGDNYSYFKLSRNPQFYSSASTS